MGNSFKVTSLGGDTALVYAESFKVTEYGVLVFYGYAGPAKEAYNASAWLTVEQC